MFAGEESNTMGGKHPEPDNNQQRKNYEQNAEAVFVVRGFHYARYPCAFSSSPLRTAAPAAPRMVLCESTVNFQSKILQ